VVYIENLSQPSILELARSGDYRALNYWIDSLLRPEGIYAHVEAAKSGCLEILVEFQQEFAADSLIVNTLRERLVKFLCHQIWLLNSPAFEGVRVVARLAGTSNILWKQSVRILTPAVRHQPRYRSAETLDWIKFKTLRSLLLMSSTVASLLIGCWVSYHEAHNWAVQAAQQPSLSAKPRRPRPDTVQAALETVPVVQHKQVFNPNDPTVTLMFGGDVTLSEELTEITDQDYGWAFSGLQDYLQADLAMINLENPLTNLTGSQSQKPNNLNVPTESVKVLTAGGIDIVNLANNHTMDAKEPGLVETIETLEKAGIHHLGAGQDAISARRPQIIEVKGQRIAYLSYNNSNVHAVGEQKLDANSQEKQQVAEDIKAIREQVDWVVVNYHWGEELAEYPGDWQIDLARFTIKEGADLVVGHHPHILQGAEIYQGRPIVYSLGDFIFGGNAVRSNYDSAVLKVSLKDRNMKVEFLPVEISKYQPKLVTGEKGNQILKHIEQISSIFDQPMRSPLVLNAPMTNGSKKDRLPALEEVKQKENQGSLEPGKSSTIENSAPKIPESLPKKPLISPSPSLPNLPKNSHNSSFFESSPNPSTESSPRGSQELPPQLKLNPPKHQSKETDPFIKEPFIKDPFILPASPKTEGPSNSQSYLPPSLTPSFQLIPREGKKQVSARAGKIEGDGRKVVQLPFVEVIDFSSV
jgi:poly-gamma-glutamate capsule biosynthesis protein CapA/YwtB (metallophosphatase superfamily)